MAYKQLKLWFDKELALLLADKLLESDTVIDKESFVARDDDASTSRKGNKIFDIISVLAGCHSRTGIGLKSICQH